MLEAELGFSEDFIDDLPLRSLRAYLHEAYERRDRRIADMAVAMRIAQSSTDDYRAAMQDLRGHD